MHVYKSKRVPPFTFFGTVRHFLKEFFFRKFQVFFQKNVLRFLSLRYSADLRRSRLVPIFASFQIHIQKIDRKVSSGFLLRCNGIGRMYKAPKCTQIP